MLFVDASRRGRPFAKDPAVVRFGGHYLLYYSLPPFGDGRGVMVGHRHRPQQRPGFLEKIGEILPEQEPERNGLCAPGAIVLDGRVHLFYQTYGNGPKDAICHAVSEDGLHFRRNPTNPIFAPTGAWNCGRAIDADVIEDGDRLLLYWATRDPAFKVQMLGVLAAPLVRISAGTNGRSYATRRSWRRSCPGSASASRRPRCAGTTAGCSCSTAAATTTSRSRSAAR